MGEKDNCFYINCQNGELKKNGREKSILPAFLIVYALKLEGQKLWL